MKRLIVFVLMLLPFMLLAQHAKMLSFSFVLHTPARVSAGVYKGDVLIRTLFNNRNYGAGEHNETWEALDDEMNPITNTDGLTVKILSNNVKYEWEGVIGNTSSEKSGNTVHHGYLSFLYLVVNEDKAYYSKGYSEGSSAQNMFMLNDIQNKERLFPNEARGVGQVTTVIATDGKNVYWGGSDPFGGETKKRKKTVNYIFATAIANDSEVIFSKGDRYKNGLGREQQSAIDITTDSLASISGLAVQKHGRFLFVSHRNELHILDKNTGELLKKKSMPVGALAVDMNDNLWITTERFVKKYAIDRNATIKSLLTLPVFAQPLAVAVSPDNKLVVVADAGKSQQLKAYDNFSGALVWTFGREGGYYESAAVTDDKFYFSDSRRTYGVSISFQKDGSFWLVDGGNCRLQHYTANRKFIEQVMYLPHNYNIYVDPNVPGRVFCDYLEFAIDYSKPLLPNNGSWKYINNWGAAITKKTDNQFMSFRPMKLSNGRTYTLFLNKQEKRYDLAELTSTNILRFAETYIPDEKAEIYLNPDGNLYNSPRKRVGLPMNFQKYPLTGFNISNDPIWGKGQTIATITSTMPLDPAYSGRISNLKPGEITSSNILIVFDGSGNGEGFHLGGIKLGDNKWLWRTARGTSEEYRGEFPTDGSFDIGNGVKYAGSVALAMDKNVFWGYHGEFWKGSQTNKWNHLYENGLMIGQFGITGPEVKGHEAAPEMAGNVMAASVVKVDDKIYLFHNDEGQHSGVHLWKISNLASVKEEIHSVSLIERKVNNKLSLVSKLPFNQSLTDGFSGWKRTPINDDLSDKLRSYWQVRTNVNSHDRFEDPDIYVKFRYNKDMEASLYKNLSANGTDSWSFTGMLNYDNNYATTNIDPLESGGQYLEILDDEGKAIFRFFPSLNYQTKVMTLVANGVAIAEDSQANLDEITDKFQSFAFKVTNGRASFKYGPYREQNIPFQDPTANYKKPAMVRLYFWNKNKSADRVISIKDFKFLQ